MAQTGSQWAVTSNQRSVAGIQRPVQPGQPPVAAVPPASVEEFITKREVARRLRKPVRTLDAWMTEGILPFYKVKHAVRFRWSEVQAHWAARYRVCPKRPLPFTTQEGVRLK